MEQHGKGGTDGPAGGPATETHSVDGRRRDPETKGPRPPASRRRAGPGTGPVLTSLTDGRTRHRGHGHGPRHGEQGE